MRWFRRERHRDDAARLDRLAVLSLDALLILEDLTEAAGEVTIRRDGDGVYHVSKSNPPRLLASGRPLRDVIVLANLRHANEMLRAALDRARVEPPAEEPEQV